MGRIYQLNATIKEAIKRKGLRYIIKKGISVWFYLFYYRIFCSKKAFLFNGKKYHYFYNIINNTWMNERSVEIPIVIEVVNRIKSKKILEVGNVLANYYSIPHEI